MSEATPIKRRRAVEFKVIWQACIGCNACVGVCPQPQPFVSAFDTIAVDTPCEIACLRCVEVCPTSAITFQRLHHDAQAVEAAQN